MIFDMDGVLVDSNPFHKLAWKEFCRVHGMDMNDGELSAHVYGRMNRDALEYLFGDLSEPEVEKYARDKENLFYELAHEKLPAVPGVGDFLQKARKAGVPMAVATSASQANVDFTMAETGFRPFFDKIVDESGVAKGKPAPDIYLKAAQVMGISPDRCVVFEDSFAGIRSGMDAGMKVVGLATTHTPQELSRETDAVVRDFNELSLEKVRKLVLG